MYVSVFGGVKEYSRTYVGLFSGKDMQWSDSSRHGYLE